MTNTLQFTDHDFLYFDKLCRSKKSESVLSLIQATYNIDSNIEESKRKERIAEKLRNAYELFKISAGSYSGSVKQFTSQYTIGHELGIWMNSNFDLNPLALEVAKNHITITEYFDIYFLNCIESIDGKVFNILCLISDYMVKRNQSYVNKENLKEIFEFAFNSENNVINGLYNMLIGTSYFEEISKDSLGCNYDPSALKECCDLRFHERAYEEVCFELATREEYIYYLIEDHRDERIVYSYNRSNKNSLNANSSNGNSTSADHVANGDSNNKKVGYNKIFYGIPGCGKSYHVENKVLKDVNKKDNVFRTTFYLDYSNSDFIGQIYPHVEDEKVTYEPIPGPFTKALERALSTDEMVYLVIEEINRGNAAAIFGDTFQLLDRLKKDNPDGRLVGDSEYPISNAFIEGYFDKRNKDIEKSGGVNKIKFTKGRIIIPHNLTILATMNTSDQNVFPLDTAFKRRWDREKVVTEWSKVGDIKKMYIPCSSITWEQFATTINNKMLQESQSGDVAISEDKQMGPYFIHENMLSKVENTGTNDDLIAFVSNVLDYLYNDVTKFDHSILFDKNIISYDMLYEKMRVYDQTGNDLFEGIFKDSVEKALVDVSVIEEPQDDDVEEESLEEPNE
ncbi:AAA family ATPase [uncultured Catenibacterium sp.]|uniref:AAA family ATPase n=1 Tax=uncultured Catenibacterium sp. TaxID=286142 RepID=UPI00259760E7|nr:AAA family ATPase [uncultured Catenibacterium sp.]